MLAAGGAFINMRVDTAWMGQVVQSMLVDGIETWAPRLPHKRAVIDFSSPNVAKEMHVGHLRSTILGDTLSRTLEYCGLEVVRLNHVVRHLGCFPTSIASAVQHWPLSAACMPLPGMQARSLLQCAFA